MKKLNRLPLLKNIISINEDVADSYELVKTIGFQIDDTVGTVPKQISDLFSFIKNNENDGKINITFTEEVKDGRSPRFNTNDPLLLKGKTFGTDEFKIKITDIKHDGNSDQPSDYNQYINYKYIADIEKA